MRDALKSEERFDSSPAAVEPNRGVVKARCAQACGVVAGQGEEAGRGVTKAPAKPSSRIDVEVEVESDAELIEIREPCQRHFDAKEREPDVRRLRF